MKLTISSASRRIALWLSTSVLALFLLAACDRDKPLKVDASQPVKTSATRDVANRKAIATDVLYVCPMHPHIQQHGPGECPICGMTLVQKAVAKPQAEPSSDINERR